MQRLFGVVGVADDHRQFLEADLYRRCAGPGTGDGPSGFTAPVPTSGPVHAVTNGVDLEYFRPGPPSAEPSNARVATTPISKAPSPIAAR